MLSGPLIYIALTQGKGNWLAFMLWMSAGVGTMYVYYSTVYSAIQDVIEPALRGTAMAIYFFAMYVVGGSFGPIVTGFLSDHYTEKAAAAAGVVDLSSKIALEPFRGEGLHSAMYIIPFATATPFGTLKRAPVPAPSANVFIFGAPSTIFHSPVAMVTLSTT